jgi:hypothetical protein
LIDQINVDLTPFIEPPLASALTDWKLMLL